MKLYAISDLHLGYEANREALEAMPEHPDDWIALAGDVAEFEENLLFGLKIFTSRFKKVFWTPGNHELWTVPGSDNELKGDAKYRSLVRLCRELGVITPEDPYETWTGPGPSCLIAPLFTLYDYSFRDLNMTESQALLQSMELGIMCNDEILLHADPHDDKAAWCRERVRLTEKRLQEAADKTRLPLVLINHYPLRYEDVFLPTIPTFSIWCGTRLTQEWHKRFPVLAVVHGHLHISRMKESDGVRFFEVSFGYPRQQRRGNAIDNYLHEILPGPAAPAFRRL